uniref:hypothetical protein n=1 Tax=Alloprevotella sp. TaxID=1872471 RepID=UPI003FF01476
NKSRETLSNTQTFQRKLFGEADTHTIRNRAIIINYSLIFFVKSFVHSALSTFFVKRFVNLLFASVNLRNFAANSILNN